MKTIKYILSIVFCAIFMVGNSWSIFAENTGVNDETSIVDETNEWEEQVEDLPLNDSDAGLQEEIVNDTTVIEQAITESEVEVSDEDSLKAITEEERREKELLNQRKMVKDDACPAPVKEQIVDPNNKWNHKLQIVLFASHFETSGATRNGYSEEMWARQVVPQAAYILKQRGYTNILHFGTGEHEMDIDDSCFNDAYPRVMISNHMNAGNAMLLYDKNVPSLQAMDKAFGSLLRNNGIHYQGSIRRHGDDSLDMLENSDQYDLSERYLLEWVNMDRGNELNWAKNTAARAKDLADLVEKVFGDRMAKVSDGQNAYVDLISQAHVQNVGWQRAQMNTQVIGTTGENHALEAFRLDTAGTYGDGGVSYTSYTSANGWQKGQTYSEYTGSVGKGKAIEAVQFKLLNEVAENYDLYYRAHVGNIGWLSWTKNNGVAGTLGIGYPLEAVELKLVKKGDTGPETSPEAKIDPVKLSCEVHIENLGWQTPKANKSNNKVCGTSGKALRLEGIKLVVGDQAILENIEYRTHIENIGWEKGWKKNGELSGTTGQAKRLEAIQIRLTGELAKKYDVYYRGHVEDYGWLDWAKNGQSAGSEGMAKRVEALEIILLPKGISPIYATRRPFVKR